VGACLGKDLPACKDPIAMPTRTPIPDHPDLTLIRGRRGRNVVRVQTPAGVVGYIGADISDKVLDAFVRALRRKIARTERRAATRSSK
jgi:hypothetical protein